MSVFLVDLCDKLFSLPGESVFLSLCQLLSFVAFILEEVVNTCVSCSALYFFEFVSCTAFLFTLLLLVLLSTTLHTRVGITGWRKVVRELAVVSFDHTDSYSITT